MASDVKVMGSGAHKGQITARLSTSRLDYLVWEHTHTYTYINNIAKASWFWLIMLRCLFYKWLHLQYIHMSIVLVFPFNCDITDYSLPTLHLLTIHSHCHCSIVTESFMSIDYHTCVIPFILLCEDATECGANFVGLPLHGLQLPWCGERRCSTHNTGEPTRCTFQCKNGWNYTSIDSDGFNSWRVCVVCIANIFICISKYLYTTVW